MSDSDDIPSQILTSRVGSPAPPWTPYFHQELASSRRITLHLQQKVEILQREVGRLSISQQDAERVIMRLEQKLEELEKAKTREKALLQLSSSQERNKWVQTAGVDFFAGVGTVNIGGNTHFNIFNISDSNISTSSSDILNIRDCHRAAPTLVTLTDATGEEYNISAFDFENLTATINSLVQRDTKSAKAQRGFVERHQFDLCIKRGSRVVPLKGQEDWSVIEQNRDILMRVIVRKNRNPVASGVQQCPQCESRHDEAAEEGTMLKCSECGSRFSITDEPSTDSTPSQDPTFSPSSDDTARIRYFHVKRDFIPSPCSWPTCESTTPLKSSDSPKDRRDSTPLLFREQIVQDFCLDGQEERLEWIKEGPFSLFDVHSPPQDSARSKIQRVDGMIPPFTFVDCEDDMDTSPDSPFDNVWHQAAIGRNVFAGQESDPEFTPNLTPTSTPDTSASGSPTFSNMRLMHLPPTTRFTPPPIATLRRSSLDSHNQYPTLYSNSGRLEHMTDVEDTSSHEYDLTKSQIKNPKKKTLQGPHYCDICNLTFTRNFDLQRHKQKHRPDTKEDIARRTCTNCGHILSRVDATRRHIDTMPDSCNYIKKKESKALLPVESPDVYAGLQARYRKLADDLKKPKGRKEAVAT